MSRIGNRVLTIPEGVEVNIEGNKITTKGPKGTLEFTYRNDNVDVKTMVLLAIATSIDALAIGVTFAFFKVNLLSAISIIGIITFVLSIIGVLIGKKFGDKLQNKAELFGGVVLIVIGLKILIEHLGIL